MAFFWKADAKVRLIFELPKLFEVFFENLFFKAEVLVSVPLFSISTHLRFSLESGCKITALQHIRQIFMPTFFIFYATFTLTRWFVDVFYGRFFITSLKGGFWYTLILLHARMHACIHMDKGVKNAPWRTSECIKAHGRIRQGAFYKTSRTFSKSSWSIYPVTINDIWPFISISTKAMGNRMRMLKSD